MKVLMVCLGNICRSPLAEGILREKVRQAGLDWTIDSAGTGSWHIGEQPDPRSIEVADRYGIDISRQRARQFRPADFQAFDLILTMDRENYRNVLGMASKPSDGDKVVMIMNLVYPGEQRPVPDPYWDDDGFEQVYHMLETACSRLLERVQAGDLP